jgi:hypothetical protein
VKTERTAAETIDFRNARTNPMSTQTVRRLTPGVVIALIFLGATPRSALACACGCGVFEIGTASLLPSEPGVTGFLEYDYSDQNRNWSGASRAPASDNSDKDIQTHFVTAGVQYMSDKGWGVMLEVPYWQRHFETDPGSGVISINHGSIGDIRILASYSGFFEDMSTGVTLGLKLPTGDYKDPHFDRDTEIGTGSTDIVLGAFHHGAFSDTSKWNYFVEAQYETAVADRGGYRPGNELNVSGGLVYSSFDIGGGLKLSPLLKITASDRDRDTGPNASLGDSGYERVLVGPGVEFDGESWRLYADVEVPIYQHMNGNQLVQPALLKVVAAYSFP